MRSTIRPNQTVPMALPSTLLAGVLTAAGASSASSATLKPRGTTSVFKGAFAPNGTWRLVSYTRAGTTVPVPTDDRLRVSMTGMRYGSYVCNWVGADLSATRSKLWISNAMSTLRGCLDVRSDWETGLTGVLVAGADYKVSGRLLTLSRGDKTFVLQRDPFSALTSGRWTPAELRTGTTVTKYSLDDNAIVEFGRDTAYFRTGCGDYDAAVTASGTSLELAPWQAPSLCGTRSTTHWWPADFNGSLTYRVSGDTLTLVKGNRTLILHRSSSL